MLKERTSAHERVRAIVVTGVTPEVGVTRQLCCAC